MKSNIYNYTVKVAEKKLLRFNGCKGGQAMGNISSGMEATCKDIVAGHEERRKSFHDIKRGIKDLKSQTEAIRDNARKFVSDCRKSHKEMTKNLKESLSKTKENLTKDVDSLRKDFQRSQKAVRQDIEGASKNWNEMHKNLYEKKTK